MAWNSGGTIINSYATGTITELETKTQYSNIGGLVGNNYKGTVTNSFWDLTSTGQRTSAGSPNTAGLSTAELKALTATSTGLSANNFDFGTNSQYPALRSYVEENGQQIQGTLLCNQPNPRRQCNEGPITPTTTLADADNDGLLDIYYIEDLDAVRNDLSASYELLRTISFTDPNSYRSGVINTNFTPNVEDPSQATNGGFPSIGNRAIVYLTKDRLQVVDGYTVTPNEFEIRIERETFEGTFEGNNFEIQDLYIRGDRGSRNGLPYIGTEFYVGLFVEISGSINNLGLTDVYIGAYDFAGGLAGSNNTGQINNTYVTGIVRGGSRVGGLVGRNESLINNSYALAQVIGYRRTGGLVGVQYNNGIITNSYATGDVQGILQNQQDQEGNEIGGLVGSASARSHVSDSYAAGNVRGRTSIGGLIGYIASRSYVNNSYAVGNVNGYDAIGGLVGSNSGRISNNYATGNIEGTEAVGGLVGLANRPSRVINNYATGNVTGNINVGGLIGHKLGSAISSVESNYAIGRVRGTNNIGALIGRNADGQNTNQILNNYYNSQTAGVESGIGYGGSNSGVNNGGFTALTTAELQALTADNSTFSANNFDFGTNNQYPALRSYVEENGQQVQGTLLCDQPNPRRQCNEGPITAPTLPVTTLVDANNNGFLDIYYIEDLDLVRNDLSASYELLRSLSFVEANSYRSGVVNTDFTPNTEDPVQATNTGFSPIGSEDNIFEGGFEGNNFTISNLYINITSENHIRAGLFKTVYGDYGVQNIGLLDVYIKATGTGDGHLHVGGLVGTNGGTISNSYVTGKITAIGNNTIAESTNGSLGYVHVGGLVGWNNNIITNSYATGNVTGKATGIVSEGDDVSVGGLVGSNFLGGIISNSYATGNVTGTATEIGVIAGGLAGFNFHLGTAKGGHISNSYATGTVTGTGENNTLGRLVGFSFSGIVINSYVLESSTGAQNSVGTGNSDGITTLTATQLQALTANNSGLSANNFDFGTNSQYPALRSYVEENGQQIQGTLLCNQPNPRRQCNEGPITAPTLPTTTLVDADNDGLLDIYYIEDLDAIRDDLSANYELLRSLSFVEADSYRSGVVNTNFIPNTEDPAQATNAGFSPIGSEDNIFEGTFEGNNFELRSLFVNGARDLGLFGTVNGEIRNIALTGLTIRGTGHLVGGLAGQNDGGLISNAYVHGIVTGEQIVGGLVGENRGVIRNSYVTASIVSGLRQIGGLAGWNSGGVVHYCYATNLTVEAESYSGGLIGVNRNASSIVTNSYAIANVLAQRLAGGLIGVNSGTIRNSYAAGTVQGGTSTGASIATHGGLVGLNQGNIRTAYATSSVLGQDRVGGLVGANYTQISNAYATGLVNGTEQTGGLIGFNGSEAGATVTNSYYNSEVSTQQNGIGAGGDQRGIAALTTAELQALTANNSGFSVNDFDFGNDSQYPALRIYVEENGERVQGTLLCNQPSPRAQCYEESTAAVSTPDTEDENEDNGPEQDNTTPIKLSPNPVVNTLTIRVEGGFLVIITNLQGTLISRQELPEGGEVDCTRLPSGMYIINVQTTEGVSYTRRILKQ